jgi:hypothetical protein
VNIKVEENMNSSQQSVTLLMHDESSRKFQSGGELPPKHLADIRPLISSPEGDECGCVRTDDGECGCLRDMTDEKMKKAKLL